MAGYSRKVTIPFDEAVEKLVGNLSDQGFGIITTIDVQDVFLQNLKVPFRNYKIISACNPQVAYMAISLESHVGAMVPCNIVVQEHENGEIEITAINALESISHDLNTTQLDALVVEVGTRLRTAIDELHHPGEHVDALPTRSAACCFPILG